MNLIGRRGWTFCPHCRLRPVIIHRRLQLLHAMDCMGAILLFVAGLSRNPSPQEAVWKRVFSINLCWLIALAAMLRGSVEESNAVSDRNLRSYHRWCSGSTSAHSLKKLKQTRSPTLVTNDMT